MKINLREFEDSFGLRLSAETLSEGALLCRFGTNTRDSINYLATSANPDGIITFYLVLAKHGRSSCDLPRRSQSRKGVDHDAHACDTD